MTTSRRRRTPDGPSPISMCDGSSALWCRKIWTDTESLHGIKVSTWLWESISSPTIRAPHGCPRSEEHTSELQSLMRISYAVFCLKKKKKNKNTYNNKN